MVLHPFLFAAAPILFLYAFNIYEASFSDALLPLAISLGVTALLFFTLSAILKNRQEAGLLVTLILVLFFSFGHFIDATHKVRSLKSIHIAWPLYALIFILGVYLIIRYRKNLKNATIILNVIAIAMVAISLFNITASTLKARPTLPKLESRKLNPAAVKDKSKLPDIYYIIFDSYASERTMKDYYGYDNSGLVTFLRSKGFYVPSEGRSNYVMTEESLSSSLNMTYLDFFSKNPGANSRDKRCVHKLMRENQVVKSLKSLGYSYTLMRNGWFAWRGETHADMTPVKS